MKILLASILPIDNPDSWSGTCNAIFQHLSKNHEVKICYSSYAHKAQKQLSKYSFVYHKITGKRLNVYFSESVSKIYGQALKTAEESFNPELIVCLGSGTELFDYNPKTKSYLVADACLSLLQDNYANYSKLSKKALKESYFVEQESIAKFDTVFATSDWAQRGFQNNYPEIACKTINLGSNIGISEFTNNTIPSKQNQINLLCVGTDYKRKGIHLAEDLQHRLGCSLDIVGIDLKLDKQKTDDLKRLIEFYKKAHFLILFPQADCSPIVINEANSFGLPVIAFDVGGIPSMISNVKNGFLVDTISEAETAIQNMLGNIDAYNSLRVTTYEHFEQHLSYTVFEKKLLDL